MAYKNIAHIALPQWCCLGNGLYCYILPLGLVLFMPIKQPAARNEYKYTYENFTTIKGHRDGFSCVSIMDIPLKVFLDVCGFSMVLLPSLF